MSAPLPLLLPLYDNSAQSTFQSGLAASTPFTWNQTTATAGAYVIIAIYGAPLTTVTAETVTFGSTTLTSLGQVQPDNNTALGWIWVWGANGVAGGSNITGSVTLNQNFSGIAVSYTYKNVGSVGALQTAFGATANPSMSASSAVGNLAWGAVLNNNAVALSAFSLSNTRQSGAPGGSTNYLSGDAPGAASVTVGCTMTATNWAVAELNLLPVPAFSGMCTLPYI